MPIRFTALSTPPVRARLSVGPDARGMAPERRVSDGGGVPCRHCLTPVAEGAPYVVLAWRPFPAPQPFAKTGPILLCAYPCERAADAPALPAILDSPACVVRGYGPDDRIVHGSGGVVPTPGIPARAEALLAGSTWPTSTSARRRTAAFRSASSAPERRRSL